MNPWELLAQSSPDQQENILDELLHNYVVMPQAKKQTEALKEGLLKQLMGGAATGAEMNRLLPQTGAAATGSELMRGQ